MILVLSFLSLEPNRVKRGNELRGSIIQLMKLYTNLKFSFHSSLFKTDALAPSLSL